MPLPAVAGGGALRIGLGQVFPDADGIPWTLLVINLVGSFTIGIVGVLWGARAHLWPLLGPGLLGGFTTFSAIAAMAWTTAVGPGMSFTILAASLIVCTLAAKAGVYVAEVRKGAL